jgi:hypothetical protein
MQQINDPLILKARLEEAGLKRFTLDKARWVLAARGIRSTPQAIREALQMLNPGPRLKPLDDLPLTPQERAIMERLRREIEP